MSKYKGKNNIYLTQALFYEWNNLDAPFTMRDTGKESHYIARSGREYLSIPYVFRESNTEYECAMTLLESYEHWKKLCGLQWFMDGNIKGLQLTGLNDWREEKKLADENVAKKVLMDAIKSGDVQAAKYWDSKASKPEAKPKGRPEKKVPSKSANNVSNIFNQIKKRTN